MYRKPRKVADTGILNLDSLMDILSCLVGVMLFIVIYTVLDIGSTAFQVQMPGERPEPLDSRQVVVFCVDGTVRTLDVRSTFGALVPDLVGASYASLPAFVQEANDRGLRDDHFAYALAYEDRVDDVGSRSRAIFVEVTELPGVVGDSIDQLDEASAYAEVLRSLSPVVTWVQFAVDAESLDVFRQARRMASERGLATGWEPLERGFPLRIPLTISGRLDLDPSAARQKPLR